MAEPRAAVAGAAAAAARRRPWLAVSVAALTLAVLGWAALAAVAVAGLLDAAEQRALAAMLAPRAGVLALFGLLLPLMLWALVRPFVAAWPRAAARLREEVAIVAAANASHRIALRGGAAELRELAAAIDALAQSHAALRDELDDRVARANAGLAEETRRLATLMSALPQGVLVCNREGRVLLYNTGAAQLLAHDEAALGLGRPIAGLLDAAVVEHAWQQVRRQLADGRTPAVARFVTARPGGERAGAAALLRGQLVPVGRGDVDGSDGYVLIVEDITRSVLEQGRREALLQALTEGTRAALANLRAAVQTLERYPAMDAARRERFTAVVNQESERLAAGIEAALADPGQARAGSWPREDIQIGDLVAALQSGLSRAAGVRLAFDGAAAPCWIEADSHALVQLITHLAGRIATHAAVGEMTLACRVQPRFVRLELGWIGAPPEPELARQWEQPALAAGPAAPTAVREVLDRHAAELWLQPAGADGMQRLCLQLPAAGGGDDAAAQPLPGRPIAYDFDLFHQAGQTAALDDTPLAALSYTVFDTETTGLRPSEGDEIIAIGAVRIVNQRLLADECFDRLTRPTRPVRASAQAVHGIGMERLAGEPPIEQVLPAFARFCADTVLVAHNAAFDMRFLELARDRTGVRFDQPVLDTLLLANVVQPAHGQDEHHLEQVAARLGVPVSGRHQALGDATVTAAVFLKLLPLLAERGIVTLGQARAASMRTAQARESF